MSLYLTYNSSILHSFIKKCSSDGKDKIREMDDKELETMAKLRDAKKAANICITEMLFVSEVIDRLKIDDLYCVSKNFHRIANSLYKQRQFVCAATIAFSCNKPDQEEHNAILKLVAEIYKRIDYLNGVPIPENIKITPIQDYLDLVGCRSFADDVKKQFPAWKDVYQSKDNGQMDNYIATIMSTLAEAGKEEAYKERLAAYVGLVNDKIAKAKAEKKEKVMAYAFNESVNGMSFFKDHFSKGIRTLAGSEKINLSKSAIHYQLNNGNRGKFCVLCCRLVKNNLAFRYMDLNGIENKSFASAGTYQSYEEAVKTMNVIKARYPADRAFDVVCI